MAVTGRKAQFGMLHIDPHGAVVWRPGDAGNLAATGADQKAAHLTRDGIGAEQLVGAHGLHGRLAVTEVGLDPQPAFAIEGKAVWRGKTVALDGAGQVRRYRLAVGIARTFRFAGQQKEFPFEACCRGVTALLVPAQYMPVQVVRTRSPR
jgi:predicted transcriptional regulator